MIPSWHFLWQLINGEVFFWTETTKLLAMSEYARGFNWIKENQFPPDDL